jgi:hypothetical protein
MRRSGSGGAWFNSAASLGARPLQPAASLRRIAHADRGRDRGFGKLVAGRMLLIAAK